MSPSGPSDPRVIMYHNWSSTCIPIALFDLKCMLCLNNQEMLSVRRKNQSRNTVSIFSRHTKLTCKIRTLCISSNCTEMVFIFEEKYGEN